MCEKVKKVCLEDLTQRFVSFQMTLLMRGMRTIMKSLALWSFTAREVRSQVLSAFNHRDGCIEE